MLLYIWNEYSTSFLKKKSEKLLLSHHRWVPFLLICLIGFFNLEHQIEANLLLFSCSVVSALQAFLSFTISLVLGQIKVEKEKKILLGSKHKYVSVNWQQKLEWTFSEKRIRFSRRVSKLNITIWRQFVENSFLYLYFPLSEDLKQITNRVNTVNPYFYISWIFCPSAF